MKTRKIKNKVIMNILVFLGVILLSLTIIYLMNYFFVEKNYIKINMSTDKKVEYIKINGKDELMTTQKYVSDLGYKMRYDVNNFKIFKYKTQDIYRFITAEKVLVIIEPSLIPESCGTTTNSYYDSCFIKVDSYTKEYYLSENTKSFKITVKTPTINDTDQNIISRIEYMLNSFEFVN